MKISSDYTDVTLAPEDDLWFWPSEPVPGVQPDTGQETSGIQLQGHCWQLFFLSGLQWDLTQADGKEKEAESLTDKKEPKEKRTLSFDESSCT